MALRGIESEVNPSLRMAGAHDPVCGERFRTDTSPCREPPCLVRAILQCLGECADADALFPSEIGNGPRYVQGAVDAPRRKPSVVDGVRHQPSSRRVQPAALGQPRWRQERVQAPARTLSLTRREHARPHERARVPGRRRLDLGGGKRGHLDLQIEAVEDRPAHPRVVLRNLSRPAAVASARMPQPAALAGVHRCDEQRPRGEAGRPGRPCDPQRVRLAWLTQSIEERARVLGESSRKSTPWWVSDSALGRSGERASMRPLRASRPWGTRSGRRIMTGRPEPSRQEPERDGERPIRHSGHRRSTGARAFRRPRLAALWWMR